MFKKLKLREKQIKHKNSGAQIANLCSIIIIFLVAVPFKLSYPSFNQSNGKFNRDSTVTISVSVTGDLMCHSVQYKYARVKKDSFDFKPVYKFVKQYLDHSDLTIANLETVVAGKKYKYSGYPLFNSPPEFISALKYAGFNLITTANNHALDKGIIGIKSTIEKLKDDGINYEGTFLSQRDRDSIRIFDLKGIKLAVLAYTYGVNNNIITDNNRYLINEIDTVLIKHDIDSARIRGADIVLVYYHFGDQYKRKPSAFQKAVVAKTISYGADIILGGHPHVIEHAEFYKTHNAKLDTGFVIYSLGNFLSNQKWRYSDAGIILNIKITKDIKRDSLYISSVKYTPTWVFRGMTYEGKRFYIIPDDTTKSDTLYKFLNIRDKKNMKQAFEDTREILSLP